MQTRKTGNKACEIIKSVRVGALPRTALSEAKQKIVKRIRSLKRQLDKKKFTNPIRRDRKIIIVGYLETVLKEIG